MMPRRRGHGSLADRITTLVLGTSALAIVLVTAVLAFAHQQSHRQVAFDALRSQAEIAAVNSVAPMAFGDVATATEVLDGLGTIDDVTAATLFLPDGTPFAHYAEAGPALERLPGGEQAGQAYVVTRPVHEREAHFGTLQVVYDLTALRAALLRNLLLSAGLGLVALVLSAFAARHGAGLLVRRLRQLEETANRVSDSGDYGVRAEVEGNDEIAGFTRTFNAMLARIEEQDEALRESRGEALAASRLKDEFLATLSHELRTPMTPIAGWAQMLPHLAAGNAQAVEAAQVIGRSARAMTRIIDDLLDMSRIVSGKLRLDVEPFRLQDVISDAVEAVRLAAEGKDITIDIDAGDVPRLRGDRHRIQQVLWNLLSNAVKFTPAGGRIDVAAREEGGMARVTVRDSGAGIPRDFVPFVFDRFRQADSSLSRPHGGLGLGLAIARQLVELHGGEISATSEGTGQGACFAFTLPLPQSRRTGAQGPRVSGELAAVDASAGEGAASGAAAGRLEGLAIVLVEDEDDTRAMVRILLASEGARVREASSADDALALLDAQAPDLLLSDIGMQGHDGYWLIGEVRARGTSDAPRLPAIALTAFAGEASRQAALDAGFDAHVCKPIDPPALVAAISRLLR